jgi:hypothetical protein
MTSALALGTGGVGREGRYLRDYNRVGGERHRAHGLQAPKAQCI